MIQYGRNNNGKEIIICYHKEGDSFPVIKLTKNQAKWILENLNIVENFAKEESKDKNKTLSEYNLNSLTSRFSE